MEKDPEPGVHFQCVRKGQKVGTKYKGRVSIGTKVVLFGVRR